MPLRTVNGLTLFMLIAFSAVAAGDMPPSVNLPVYRALMDVDFFGAEKDRIPWSEIDDD